MLSTTLGLLPTPTHAASQTIRVPEDFQTIQAAVNAANPGDTILVAAGTYNEGAGIYKSVTLMGDESLNTIIDGGSFYLANVSNVVISRFKIRKTGEGICLRNCTNCTFNDNVIIHTYPGPGFRIEYSDGNVICNNTLIDCTMGIALGYSNGNFLSKNNISNCTYFNMGIVVFLSQDNFIDRNVISRSWAGIYLLATHNTFKGNEILKNDYGIWMNGANYNTFYHNNLINNTHQTHISEDETNIWNCGYPYGGNYWSDYNGADLYCGRYQNVTGSDGIGDIPYVINEHNRDGYPLMNPWVPKVPGNINGDSITDIFDLTTAATAYASKPGYPNWNPNADVYTDQIIDIFDFVIIAVNYGKTAEDP